MWPQLLAAVRVQLFFLAITYIIVTLFVFLDLWSGIRKAKERGQYRSSYGLRKTIDKMCRYMNMMLVLTAIDTVQMLALWQLASQGSVALPRIPVMTFIGAIFVGFIEIKSIWEKTEKKERARMDEAVKVLAKMAKDREMQDVLANFVEYLKIEKKNDDNAQL